MATNLVKKLKSVLNEFHSNPSMTSKQAIKELKSICQEEIESACKKQRQICADEIKDMNFTLSEIVRIAPLPKDTK